jgi:6-pyruvoyl-tetrahydropterin synthase
MTTRQPSVHPLVRAHVGGAGWDFPAAHTGLHAGVLEPLHGHTYQVTLTVHGAPDQAGMVADFGVLKHHLREVIAPLKRRTLIAVSAPGLAIEQASRGQIQVRGGDACFALPRSWLALLPITATTTEALAAYLAEQLGRRAVAFCPAVVRLELTLAESAECSATTEVVLR